MKTPDNKDTAAEIRECVHLMIGRRSFSQIKLKQEVITEAWMKRISQLEESLLPRNTAGHDGV